MGTNNEELRNDPLYIGLNRPRASLAEVGIHVPPSLYEHRLIAKATEFMDTFMSSAASAFPAAVIQHEDFSSAAAFAFLEKYKEQYRMFNDDIEG
jgi:malate dehydrogenase (oxaloacetate-decarboxylating)(NADP+)